MKLKILPQKCVLYLCAKLTSWGRPENFTHPTSLWDVYKTSLRRFPKKNVSVTSPNGRLFGTF